MPDLALAKAKPHPARVQRETPSQPRPSSPTPYAELLVTSNFTFLNGASHPEELVEEAARLGHAAAAISDTNTLAGIVRAHVAAKELGIPLAVGCRLALTTGPAEAPAHARRRLRHGLLEVAVFPASRPAYARLSRLLTLGKRRAPKGECHLALEDLLQHQEGLLALVAPPLDPPHPRAGPDACDEEGLERALLVLREVFDDDRLSLVACRGYGADDELRLRRLAALSRRARVPLVASNDVKFHESGRRPLQDVLACIRHGCTIDEAGFRLHANAERRLKPPEEMARLFADHPAAVARSAEIARRASAFSLDELRYEYPLEGCPPGLTPMEHLRRLTWAGARRRYPDGVPERVASQLRHELALIEELRYEAYFLTCHDIVEFARSRGILCQGRGGAANSAVCYCLGITEVDPARFSLLFERFVSRARGEPPDIDIDFEHERREEVIQHIYRKYGRDRAALTAEVITYRGRSAVRDVGKAMGLSADAVDALARNLDRWHEPPSDDRVRECGLDPEEPLLRQVIGLARELVGFPRHLSQHVGGFVITRSPLCELVPIENAAMPERTVIEWDKDDIDAMGMLKVDVLGLGMLTCIRKALELTGLEHSAIAATDDPAVYDMICRADTVGVFQIESRAQMSMLPRLRPRCFYDLVIEVAIVRPGPIQGKMVHPYLRRRTGQSPVSYPSEAVRAVLERTLGVPLFQEQAMQLAIVAAGFTPDEADQLRRAMAAWRRKGDRIYQFGQRLVAGMIANGYPEEFARRCFDQIKGFSEYGFPESHAASFALLVYVSAWLKHHHPAAFAAALINSQPMGFYAPAQIVRDAAEHGVEVLPVDVNASAWDCTLERPHSPAAARASGRAAPPALRLGLRLVSGLAQAEAERLVEAVRRHGPFRSVESLWRRSGISVGALRRLARADAFGSMGLDRQAALWQVRPLRDEPLPLFAQHDAPEAAGLETLPSIGPLRRTLEDYRSTGLSLKAHPVSFLRPRLTKLGVAPAARLRDPDAAPQNHRIAVAGVVLVRQRPATASGVVFATLEDETGIANLILWPRTFDRCRKAARLSTLLLARGHVERQGEVVHVHVEELESLDHWMPALVASSRDFH